MKDKPALINSKLIFIDFHIINKLLKGMKHQLMKIFSYLEVIL